MELLATCRPTPSLFPFTPGGACATGWASDVRRGGAFIGPFGVDWQRGNAHYAPPTMSTKMASRSLFPGASHLFVFDAASDHELSSKKEGVFWDYPSGCAAFGHASSVPIPHPVHPAATSPVDMVAATTSVAMVTDASPVSMVTAAAAIRSRYFCSRPPPMSSGLDLTPFGRDLTLTGLRSGLAKDEPETAAAVERRGAPSSAVERLPGLVPRGILPPMHEHRSRGICVGAPKMC